MNMFVVSIDTFSRAPQQPHSSSEPTNLHKFSSAELSRSIGRLPARHWQYSTVGSLDYLRSQLPQWPPSHSKRYRSKLFRGQAYSEYSSSKDLRSRVIRNTPVLSEDFAFNLHLLPLPICRENLVFYETGEVQYCCSKKPRMR